MKIKGICIAIFLFMGIIGIYRQMTADTITFEEAFSVIDRDIEEKAIVYQPKEKDQQTFIYDMRGQELPPENADTEGEYYTEGYEVRVYFTEESKEQISAILPDEARIQLNVQTQVYLDEQGYGQAEELLVVNVGLAEHQGFLFQAEAYPDQIFEVYWDGEKLQFGEVGGYFSGKEQ